MHNDLHIHDNAIVYCSHVGMRLLLGTTREEDQLPGSRSKVAMTMYFIDYFFVPPGMTRRGPCRVERLCETTSE